MRIIFDELDGELFFEIVLTQADVDYFERHAGVHSDFAWNVNGIKLLNVFVRAERNYECLSSKEKQQVVGKDFLKISKEKSPSLIAKRVMGKKILKKERSNGKSKEKRH
jgi:hypothetical protein